MKNEASDASWIGTITSILFTNAKTLTNYTYVLLLIRVSVSVALLNSFKSMYLRPHFNGSRQIFQRTKLARIIVSRGEPPLLTMQGSTFRDFGTRGTMQVFDRQSVQNFVAELARSRVNGLHR